MMNSADSGQSELKQKIGQRIHTIRKLRGLTQEQLAEYADLSVEFISVLERGLSWPSIKSLNAVGTALRIPFWMLLGPTRLEPSLNQLVTLFPNLVLNEQRYDRVLITSNSWDIREGVRDLLADCTFIRNIQTVATVALALNEIENQLPDVLITDLETDGLETSGLLDHNGVHAQIPISILITPANYFTDALHDYQKQGHVVMRRDEIVDYLVPLIVAVTTPFPKQGNNKGASDRQ